MDESKPQTAHVLERIGEGNGEAVSFERWHTLDKWIALGSRDAVFQPIIGKLANPVAPRLRRDPKLAIRRALL